MSEMGQKWKNLSLEENNVFTQKAEEVRKDPLKGKTRKEKINLHLSQLSLAVSTKILFLSSLHKKQWPNKMFLPRNGPGSYIKTAPLQIIQYFP